jgi:hypothetical protein
MAMGGLSWLVGSSAQGHPSAVMHPAAPWGEKPRSTGLSGAFVVDKVDKVIINTPEMA